MLLGEENGGSGGALEGPVGASVGDVTASADDSGMVIRLAAVDSAAPALHRSWLWTECADGA